jgi:hypothetical protein
MTHVLLDRVSNDLGFEVKLFFGSVRVHFAEDVDSLSEFVAAEEVARRFGKVREESELKELRSHSGEPGSVVDSSTVVGRASETYRRNGTESDHVPPSVRDVLERQVEAVSDDLTERDRDDVERDETTTERSRSEFSDVERNDERSESDSETDDQSTDCHDPVSVMTERDGLHDCAAWNESVEEMQVSRNWGRDIPAPTMKIKSARPMTSLRPMRSAKRPEVNPARRAPRVVAEVRI